MARPKMKTDVAYFNSRLGGTASTFGLGFRPAITGGTASSFGLGFRPTIIGGTASSFGLGFRPTFADGFPFSRE